jgi:hypothetical protein
MVTNRNLGVWNPQTAERWGIRVFYASVKASSQEEAVRKVREGKVDSTTHAVIWEDHQEVDEVLSVRQISD